jgi:hypothetical protein
MPHNHSTLSLSRSSAEWKFNPLQLIDALQEDSGEAVKN